MNLNVYHILNLFNFYQSMSYFNHTLQFNQSNKIICFIFRIVSIKTNHPSISKLQKSFMLTLFNVLLFTYKYTENMPLHNQKFSLILILCNKQSSLLISCQLTIHPFPYFFTYIQCFYKPNFIPTANKL